MFIFVTQLFTRSMCTRRFVTDTLQSVLSSFSFLTVHICQACSQVYVCSCLLIFFFLKAYFFTLSIQSVLPHELGRLPHFLTLGQIAGSITGTDLKSCVLKMTYGHLMVIESVSYGKSQEVINKMLRKPEKIESTCIS